MNEEKIIAFVKNLTTSDIQQKVNNAAKIEKESCINENTEFFKILANCLNRITQ